MGSIAQTSNKNTVKSKKKKKVKTKKRYNELDDLDNLSILSEEKSCKKALKRSIKVLGEVKPLNESEIKSKSNAVAIE